MKKYILALLFTGLMLVEAVAMAFNPGQRTLELLGATLNSDRKPVHIVLEQKIDMANILTAEAYAKLTPAQQVRINRIEYNEAGGINGERMMAFDGEGKLLQDVVSYSKAGYWYSVDLMNKSYDRLPELPGMSIAFAETLVSWFSQRPEAGYDAELGYDYDMMTKGKKQLYFYYAKDSKQWMGYKVGTMPMYTVVEYSGEVDEASSFPAPGEDYARVPNERMRNYANRLMLGR